MEFQNKSFREFHHKSKFKHVRGLEAGGGRWLRAEASLLLPPSASSGAEPASAIPVCINQRYLTKYSVKYCHKYYEKYCDIH